MFQHVTCSSRFSHHGRTICTAFAGKSNGSNILPAAANVTCETLLRASRKSLALQDGACFKDNAFDEDEVFMRGSSARRVEELQWSVPALVSNLVAACASAIDILE